MVQLSFVFYLWTGTAATHSGSALLLQDADADQVQHFEREAGPPAPPQPRRTSAAVRFAMGYFESVQVNVDAEGRNIIDDAANEPSIAVDPLDPRRMAIGWRQFDSVRSNFRQSGVAYSHDGGESWTFIGSLWPGNFGSDPVLDSDSLGNFYYSAIGYGSPGVRFFRSFDRGVSWDGPLEITRSFEDKQWLAIDRTGGIGDGNMYMTWSALSDFTRSTDGGLTWDAPTPAPTGIWGTISVGPDGEVYLVDNGFNVAVSFDAQDANVWPPTFSDLYDVDLGGMHGYGGAPNPGGLMGQPWIVTDHSGGPSRGTVYVLCSVRRSGSDPMDVKIARSDDGGESWTPAVRVNDDPPGNDAYQWFGTLSIAPSGRLDAVWYDTRHTGQPTLSQVFYAWSTDRGQTWSPNAEATPAFDSTIGWPAQNKIGDYIHMFSDDLGGGLAYAATFNGEQDVYFMRIAIDCNGNGLHDGDDIAAGRSLDENENSIPDECECDPCDANCDDRIDPLDIEPFIESLLDPNPQPCAPCVGDANGDGEVDAFDIEPFLNCLIGP